MKAGPFAPGTVVSVAPGNIAWENPNNSKVSDDTYATETYPETPTPALAFSEYLRCTNFNGGSIVPAGSTINSWKFTVHRKSNRAAAAYSIDEEVYTRKSSGQTGSNKARRNPATDKWPTTEAPQEYTFVNGIDAVISDTDMNSTAFGLDFKIGSVPTSTTAVISSVDYVELTEVDYTPPAAASFIPQVRTTP
jgi:hypothetical protein